MKKQIKTIVLALIALVSVSGAYAHENKTSKENTFDVGMYFDNEAGKIKTFVEKESGRSVLIYFLDSKGNQLGSTLINRKEEKGMVTFDVNDLPDGTYQLKFTDGVSESLHTLDISRPQPKQVVKFH